MTNKQTHTHTNTPGENLINSLSHGPSYSQHQDQAHRSQTIKVVNIAKNIETSTEYENILYTNQFSMRNWYMGHSTVLGATFVNATVSPTIMNVTY